MKAVSQLRNVSMDHPSSSFVMITSNVHWKKLSKLESKINSNGMYVLGNYVFFFQVHSQIKGLQAAIRSEH